ncbi:MAG: sugar ABC transporter permease [Firmicutes bacterium]|jgi:putative aldouronate transport system permease protein|nr:sugar ABC transporter permease [Bacillota bacterium]
MTERRRHHNRASSSKFKRLQQDKGLYLMLLPGLIVVILFNYLPMYGAIIAFKDFNIIKGITGSPWVGLKHFSNLLYAPEFYRVFRNTLLISFYRLVFQFPLPIILALLINEIRNLVFKRSIQTITYLPHFLSWVIVGALTIDLLSPSGGLINKALTTMDLGPVTLMDKKYFRTVLVASQTWKEVGWSAIIYLAAISSIDTELYEAAVVDGANRWKQTWHITLPGIRSTVVFIILLRISALMITDVEQVLMLYNPLVYEVGDVIGTYVYRQGLGRMKYSYATAVGLFQSVVGFACLVVANRLSRKYTETSMW